MATLKKIINHALLGLLIANSSQAVELTSETEMCASVASQYRYFHDAYENGATWNPFLPSQTAKSKHAQAGLYNALLISSYSDKTDRTKSAINQELIKLAFKSYQDGKSVTFGQYYVFFNCKNMIAKNPNIYYRCDTFFNEQLNKDGMERFYECASAL
jgi:hypothetical protein